jgi:hypothetical protein
LAKATTRKITSISGAIIMPNHGMGHQSLGMSLIYARGHATSVTLPLDASRPRIHRFRPISRPIY